MKKYLFLLFLAFVFVGCSTKDGAFKKTDEVFIQPVKLEPSNVNLTTICENQNQEQCFASAKKAYEQQNYALAIRIFDKGCSGYQYIPSCLRLAKMLEEGEGCVKNVSLAKSLYTRACFSGYKPSCKEMKRLEK